MSKDIGITLFDLKTSSSFVVVAGGGGNPLYGKENGIVVINKNDLNEANGLDFYKTKDFIKEIYLYVENTPCDDFEEDDTSCDRDVDSTNSEIDIDVYSTISSALQETPEESEDIIAKTEGYNTSKLGNTTKIYVDPSDISKTETGGMKSDAGSERNDVSLHKFTVGEPGYLENIAKSGLKSLSDETIYIAAVGESSFYLLKYNGVFTLLIENKCKAKAAYLTKHLLLLSNHTIHGFYDVINNPKIFKISHKKMNLDNSDEEYFYKTYRRNKRIIYKREFGTDDIPDDWDGFFVHNNRIHKILYEQGVSTFVFNNKKHSYGGKIPKVLVLGDSLVFYTIQDSISLLYFLGNSEIVFQLPKITCISNQRNTVIVATSTGYAIVYVNQEFYCKCHLSELPITGISIEGNVAYFSIITGLVSSIKIKKSRYYYGFILAVIAIIIGLILAYFKK